MAERADDEWVDVEAGLVESNGDSVQSDNKIDQTFFLLVRVQIRACPKKATRDLA
jgi:hypothetical protein